MKPLKRSQDAARALVKLLVKLQLLEPSQVIGGEQYLSATPLSYYERRNNLKAETAARVIAKALHIPFVKMNSDLQDRSSHLVRDRRLEKISVLDWKSIRAIPIDINPAGVMVAFANPLDHELIKSLEFSVGMAVQCACALEDEILSVLDQREHFATGEFNFDEMLRTSRTDVAGFMGGKEQAETNVTGADSTEPLTIRLVNKLFSDAVRRGASDIHISPEQERVVARIRVDGVMQDLLTIPSSLRASCASRIKLLSGMNISEQRKPQDGRLRIRAGSQEKDLRVSSMPTLFGENIVIRILSSDLRGVSFSSLGMPEDLERRFTAKLKGSSRVLLVCGPTGSGKTSTLYTGLHALRDGKSTIVTIEDPIEYRLEGVSQIQVNQKAGLSFAEGLRSVLRQDPDVIMVGEIRDGETASIVMQSAQTGHIVLSTLHTNDAPSALTRLRDLGLAPFIIASSVGAVLAQRLVRKICTACATQDTADRPDVLQSFGIKREQLRHGAGCDACNRSGFKGRQALYSYIEITQEIAAAIRDGKDESHVSELARSVGFQTLEEAGIELVKQGVTTLEEVESVLGCVETWPPIRQIGKIVCNLARNGHGLQKRTVLLIDDDKDARLVLSMRLKQERFEVIEAKDGYDALDKLFEMPPDVVVCDLMMPNMDGREFVHRLRSDMRTKNIPVLMLTAADTADNELQMLQNGARDFMSKTVDSKIMVARIQKMIEELPLPQKA